MLKLKSSRITKVITVQPEVDMNVCKVLWQTAYVKLTAVPEEESGDHQSQ